MSTRLVRGTASRQGRNIFIHPGNSLMRQISYGRIRLNGDQTQASFANQGQETGLICLRGEYEVFNLWSESSKFDFRAEAFNVLNQVNYQVPDSNITDGAFGSITSAYPPRQLQLAAKIIF